ncbi:MAG: phage tail protein [Oscillospiraceae bacterium]|nr:phage tail protein [Oscillospiraceae bacterium]
MLELLDRQMRKIEILENAYNIRETESLNAVNHLEFILPDTDIKAAACLPFLFVRFGESGDAYRLIGNGFVLTEKGHYLFKAEHVFALLIDDILEGDHRVGNIGTWTRESIQYVLDRQLTENWVLGDCEFDRQFEYEWTDETLLSAILSIPQPIGEPFMWTFDTSTYPFRLNLVRLNMDRNPDIYVRAGKNALRIGREEDATTVVTRLYPKGDGEGVNSLTIANVNNGVPYLQSPPEIVEKYGIVQRVWRDKRFTVAQNLLDAAKAMLLDLQEPFEQYEVEFELLDDRPQIGSIVEIVGFKRTVITQIQWRHDEMSQTKISVANKPRTAAGTISAMSNRQRIQANYALGSTFFYSENTMDNSDGVAPVELRFRIPFQMAVINEIRCFVRLSQFRTTAPPIQRFGNATQFEVRLNGQYLMTIHATENQFSLVPHLLQNSTIQRGIFHTVEIVPNDAARVDISCYIQGFVRSTGTYAIT